jgi:hypothetical protein
MRLLAVAQFRGIGHCAECWCGRPALLRPFGHEVKVIGLMPRHRLWRRLNHRLIDLLKRKPAKLAGVAQASKMTRVAWRLMVIDESYSETSDRHIW